MIYSAPELAPLVSGCLDDYLPYVSRIEVTVNAIANRVLKIAIEEVDGGRPVTLMSDVEEDSASQVVVLEKMSSWTALALRMAGVLWCHTKYMQAPIEGFKMLKSDHAKIADLVESIKGLLGRAQRLSIIKLASDKQEIVGYPDYGCPPNELIERFDS